MSKILIFGLQRSGKALYFLLKNDNEIWLYDDSPKDILPFWKGEILLSYTMAKNNIASFDLLLISPSIPLDNPIVLLAKQNGVKVLNEFEFCFFRSKGKKLCVTGTDGKTTVTKLIDTMLSAASLPHRVVGNIGIPFATCCEAVDNEEVVVAEVSSFMLSGQNGISPHIAVVTNIASDHLDWHKNQKNYAKAKANITKFQTDKDFLIINADDQNSGFLRWQTRAKVLCFSSTKKADAYYANDALWLRLKDNTTKKIVDVCDTTLVGQHNYENALAAILACSCLGVDAESMRLGLKNFALQKHRLQIVGKKQNVIFVNDSKATTPHATMAAIKSFNGKKICLILGGSDKSLLFDQLFTIDQVLFFVFVGDTASVLQQTASKYNKTNFKTFECLRDAVGFLFNLLSKTGGIVLFSPACAAFDSYKNYEERGDAYTKIVEELCQ